jgi:SPP1 family holin
MNKLNLSGVEPSVIVRGLLTIIAAFNIICGYLGWHIIPLNDSELSEIGNAIIIIITVVIWAWGWWKNNSLTANAQAADELLSVWNEEPATNTEV